MNRIFAPLAAGATLMLAACGPPPGETPEADSTTAATGQQGAAPAAPPLVPPGEEADATPLTPAGFGPHVVGEPLAIAGSLDQAEITPRASENCRIFRDPDRPGVTVMTDGSIVTRVSVEAPSTIITGAGIAIGAAEADVRAVYPELRQVRDDAGEGRGGGANNLYTAAAGDDALRFEIGPDGNVFAMHGGSEPALSASEGCA